MGVWGPYAQWVPEPNPLMGEGWGLNWRHFVGKTLFYRGFKMRAWLYESVQYMKWKKNQFGGRKVVRQPTILAHWVQKVGGQPLCPISCAVN